MGDASKGIYNKFDVRRRDGSDGVGGKHEGCEYFVLDLTHDKFAAPALRAYADACAVELPLLAADLVAIATECTAKNYTPERSYNELGRILAKYLDRLNDPVESDPLEKIVGELIQAVDFSQFGEGRSVNDTMYSKLLSDAAEYHRITDLRDRIAKSRVKDPVLVEVDKSYRGGTIRACFATTKEVLDYLDGKYCHLGEVLGKHSEVSFYFEEGSIYHIVSTDPHTVLNAAPDLIEIAEDVKRPYVYLSGHDVVGAILDRYADEDEEDEE